MSGVALAGRVPVTRLRRAAASTVDAYGEEVPGPWKEVPLPPAWYAPGASTEPKDPGAAPVATNAGLYWRGARPDVVATDRLVIDGVTHEVVGDPAPWPAGLHVTVTTVHTP